MRIIVYNGNEATEITEFTEKKTWSGDINSAPRKLQFKVLLFNINIPITLGQIVMLTNGSGTVLFKGIILNIDKDKNYGANITAYDSMFYLANNSDTFVFSNISIGGIIQEFKKRFNIPLGKIEDSTYRITSLPITNMSAYDYFKKAEKQTFDHTGERFVLRDNNGKIELLKRREQIHDWVIEKGNLIDFSYTESAEDLKTRIKLVNKENKKTLVATAANSEMINRFGILQGYKSSSEKSNQAQLNQKAKEILRQKSKIQKSLQISCIGLNDVLAGDSIVLNIPRINAKKVFYVQKDTHNFSKNNNTNLTLLENLEI